MMDLPGPRRVTEVALSNVGPPSVAVSGEHKARFRSVFEAGFDYVWNTVRRLGVAPRDLEDVSHDVLLDVYRKIDSYDPTRPLKPWLFAFSYRAASEYRRRSSTRREIGAETEAVDDRPLADEQLIERQDRALVAAALESIDLDRRAVLVLHDLDDVPIPEIACTLGIPLNTAYSRLRTARERFVKALKRLRSRQVAT